MVRPANRPKWYGIGLHKTKKEKKLNFVHNSVNLQVVNNEKLILNIIYAYH